MVIKRGAHLWEHHPHVRSDGDLTFGERAADYMRDKFGSWGFVGGFLVFMGLWMILNTLLLGPRGYDKYPYILLNLMLSMMAGLQGALILIAAKRADRVAAEQATAHYAETAKIDLLLSQNTDLTRHVETLAQDLHDHIVATAPGSSSATPGVPVILAHTANTAPPRDKA